MAEEVISCARLVSITCYTHANHRAGQTNIQTPSLTFDTGVSNIIIAGNSNLNIQTTSSANKNLYVNSMIWYIITELLRKTLILLLI